MRSGSSAHDGRGWSPAQHPHSGRGPQPEREDVPFGSEFDSGEYRQLVESSYGYPADGRHPREPDYTHVDPRQGRQQYQQPHRRPADDYDYGYGDPGYADPSYDGPRGSGAYQAYQSAPVAPAPIAPAPSAPPTPPPPAYQPPPAYPPAGYQQPWPGSAAGADRIYPVTGAQEVYREGPRQAEPPRYEEPRYDEPRQAADPRLAGIRYDELHYDDAEDSANSRYDEPLDDDAWYEELRRGGPAFQQQPSRPAGPSPSARPEGYQQAPAQDWPSSQPQNPGNSGNGGGHGGYGPRMSAVPAPGAGSGPMVGLSRAPGTGTGTPGAQASPMALGFQAAPVFAQPSSVGVLTPPAGSRYQTRVDAPQAFSTQPRLAAAPPAPVAPAATEVPYATAAMPAMTGPDTAAWDIETEDDELDALEQYWQEDDGHSALLDDPDEDDVRVRKSKSKDKDSKPATTVKRIGRRRGGSNDHKLLLGLVGIVVVAGGAIFGITKFAFPHGNGPAHELVVPASVGSYQWAPKLEKSANLGPLINQFRAGLGSSATNVVSRVYESGSATTGSSPQLVAFIGGHLPNQSPASSIANFTQKFKGAQVVSAGPMGGQAVCTQASIGTNSVALCAWFDNDSVGVIWSTTLSAANLDQVMLQFRPQVEHLKK
ncbi:MAG TPA: hypothetical protein VFB06_07030 [Streptosporangiaceae bacterium]|nr:hypothetical protein [Streptosporangiaceae bacterium]